MRFYYIFLLNQRDFAGLSKRWVIVNSLYNIDSFSKLQFYTEGFKYYII